VVSRAIVPTQQPRRTAHMSLRLTSLLHTLSSTSLNSYTVMPTPTHAVNQQGQASSSADDGKVIARTLAALNTLEIEYECPICLDALTDTHINPECLHRFCGDCIKESLRRCNNECPSCRVHIPTKRTMRKDTQFDKIVSKCSVMCLLYSFTHRCYAMRC